MRVEKRDGSRERRILSAMCLHTVVLGRVASRWDSPLFASRWANIVGKWCVDYYRRYEQAPRNAVGGLFETWADKGADEETTTLVGAFLTSLEEECSIQPEETPMNAEYMIDLAGSYFNRVRLARLAEEVQASLDTGRSEDAEKVVTDFKRVTMGVGSGIDMLHDKAAVLSAFAQDDYDAIVSYPGTAGQFFGQDLARDSFVVFCGPSKSGKTWWLLDLAWRALLQRRRVAFFEVGDLSERQIMTRFSVRAARHPTRSPNGNWPATIRVPEKIEYTKGADTADVNSRSETFDRPLDGKTAWAACQRVMANKVKSEDSYFKLSCHPNLSIDVDGIDSILAGWELTGWIADVVVVDYADLLSPLDRKLDSRDAVNLTWKKLRALSSTRHCLLATATQSNAESFDTKRIDRKHFSEDNRKLAHVTAMYGINVSPEDKVAGVVRLNHVVRREDYFSNLRFLYAAGCLSLANPCVRSCF